MHPLRTLSLICLALISIVSCSRDTQASKLKYVANGDQYLAAKNYPAAVIEYRNAIAQDANFGEARLKLGLVYQAMNDRNNALREYTRAADLMPKSVDAQLSAGHLLLTSGQYPEARARATAALAVDPKNTEAMILLGNALVGMKDIEGALSQIEEAVEADPHVTLAYGNLGVIQMSQGQQTAAESTFKRAAEVDPSSVPAHLNLGNYFWASGRLDEAERELKAAFELDPKSGTVPMALATFYTSTGRAKEAERYLKAYAEARPAARVVLADFYVGQGRLKDAADVLESLSQDKAGFVPAKLRLAAISFQDGRRDQAYQTLDEILAREPANEAALESRARFLMREQRYPEAIAVADTVLKRNDNAIASRYVRGFSLESTRPDQAVVEFQELLKRAPASLPGQLELAKLYTARGEPKAAVEILGGAVKAHSQSGTAHFLLGQALLSTGDVPGAERQLVPVAQARPSDADAQTWLGLLYQAKKEPAKARSAFARALQLAPHSRSALAGMISADLAEKKFDAARGRVKAAVTAEPKDANLLALAGDTYSAIGDNQDAQVSYETLLQVDPNNIDAFTKLGVLYHSQGRLAEAKAKYEQLAARQQRPSLALTLLGMISELERNPTAARTNYERALALDPKSAVAANNLAWMHAESGQNLDLALQLAQTAKSQLPDSSEVNDTLGWVYYKKGLTGLAISPLESAVKQRPKDASVRFRLGLAYVKNGEQQKAQTAFEEALKTDPTFAQAEDARRELATLKQKRS
jgi:putative PEP-CTERM system TPR-repeat lipoprotein